MPISSGSSGDINWVDPAGRMRSPQSVDGHGIATTCRSTLHACLGHRRAPGSSREAYPQDRGCVPSSRELVGTRGRVLPAMEAGSLDSVDGRSRGDRPTPLSMIGGVQSWPEEASFPEPAFPVSRCPEVNSSPLAVDIRQQRATTANKGVRCSDPPSLQKTWSQSPST